MDISCLVRSIRCASADERGSTLMMFAMMFGTLALMTGISLDYARLLSVESALQRDLDSAVLGAATQSVSEDLSADDIATNYFGNNWRQTHNSGNVTVALTTGEGEIAATATAPVPMTLMKMFGYNTLDAQAQSAVSLGGQDVEIALVLDTTGSMAGQKLDDLKQAAHRLIDTVFDVSGAEEHIKVGLVPFAQYVNVGLANRSQSWLTVEPDGEETSEQCQTVNPVTGQSNCRTQTATGYDDGDSYSYSYQVCDYQYGPEENQCSSVTTTKKWNGCVGSRSYPLNVRDEQYSTRIPGIMNVTCSSQLKPLTNDKASLKADVLDMTANNDTYIPAGLMWGWRILSKEAPFSDGASYGEVQAGKVRKMLVLMTDGHNTRSPNYPDHEDYQQSVADSLTVELCDNIKSAGIDIYTIAFDVTDSGVLDRMRSCASELSKHFATSSGEELKQAFQKIGRSTRKVSLSE